LRALAVGSQKRNAFLPDVPAISDTLPDFVSMTWQGLVAPPGTPAEIANKLSVAVAEALQHPAVSKQLVDSSLDAIGSTPAEMAAFMKEERERWRKVVQVTGVAGN
jgi:tripartite-type tricarboxylate transporter receptor subunit TctC